VCIFSPAAQKSWQIHLDWNLPGASISEAVSLTSWAVEGPDDPCVWNMLIIGRTLLITLNATSSRSCTLSCLAKRPLQCIRRCFQSKARHGFWWPQYTDLPAGTPEPARAFSASTQVVDGLFERSSLQRYLRDLEQEHAESVQRLNSTQASPEEEEEERAQVLRRRVTELTPVITELEQLRIKMQELQDIESLLTGKKDTLFTTCSGLRSCF